MPGNFFDSNILLYLALRGTPKADQAEFLLEGGGHISVQVLNESANVLRLKYKCSWAATHDFIDHLKTVLRVHSLTAETHDTGLRLAERYGFSIYDSFIVAAALQADCETLWTEDMQDGLLIENRLRIANPFTSLA